LIEQVQQQFGIGFSVHHALIRGTQDCKIEVFGVRR